LHGTVSKGPGGATIETSYSLLGVKEVTKMPRWMITCQPWIFLGAQILGALYVVAKALENDRQDLVLVGLGILGFAFLIGAVIYLVYYRPPRRPRTQQSDMAEHLPKSVAGLFLVFDST
jgi:hypothetical protein